MRILLYDLEISPMLCWAYEMWDARILKVERPPYIMCMSWKWYGERSPHVTALPDFTLYNQDRHDDFSIVEKLHGLLDETDIVVAHNAKKFDNRVAAARFIWHEMDPPSPYRTVDTLVAARKYFRFAGNSLSQLCEQLDIGHKARETHAMLWHDCINGDSVAWEKMKQYCSQDVALLSSLYDRLLPYIGNHPNISTEKRGCPRCGSTMLHYRGYTHTNVSTFRRVQCQECGAWSRERKSQDNRAELVNLL